MDGSPMKIENTKTLGAGNDQQSGRVMIISRDKNRKQNGEAGTLLNSGWPNRQH